ncbi:unnamed protein product [Enterobius vermicularis]|uniref:Acetyltransf_18 domain-containing protein n=1 Tax=Enterobius vermicularis TaxID=51028 RepID=A0A0N4VMX0_ENTVE|nr:unnamed protein product [Enterobius vermicularis]
MGKIAEFDRLVSGASRRERLEKLLSLEGVIGLASINQTGEVNGYGIITVEGKRRNPVIGPIYARTSFAALQLTNSLCSVVDHFNEVCCK